MLKALFKFSDKQPPNDGRWVRVIVASWVLSSCIEHVMCHSSEHASALSLIRQRSLRIDASFFSASVISAPSPLNAIISVSSQLTFLSICKPSALGFQPNESHSRLSHSHSHLHSAYRIACLHQVELNTAFILISVITTPINKQIYVLYLLFR